MQLSSKLPVAVHILLAIAYFEGKYKTTSDFLAGSIGTNPVVVRKIIGMLKDAGLVQVRGKSGPSLCKDLKKITLLDVFYAVEKDRVLFPFHDKPNPMCPVGRNIHNVLDDKLLSAEKIMEEELQKVTLDSLLHSLHDFADHDEEDSSKEGA